MIPIIVLDDEKKAKNLPDICYILSGDGLFVRTSNAYYDIVKKVDGISFLGDMKESIQLYFPKLPWNIIMESTEFFKDVYDKYQSEAVVLLYINLELKEWKHFAPDQTIRRNSLHVDYDIDAKFRKSIPKGFKLFGSIHSHGNAGAFHSGTDDTDDANVDGIHITIGNITSASPAYASRLIIAGKEVKVKMANITDIPKATYDKSMLTKVTEKAPYVAPTAAQRNDGRFPDYGYGAGYPYSDYDLMRRDVGGAVASITSVGAATAQADVDIEDGEKQLEFGGKILKKDIVIVAKGHTFQDRSTAGTRKVLAHAKAGKSKKKGKKASAKNK